MVSALLIYKNAGGCLRCSKRQGNITYNGHYLMEKKRQRSFVTQNKPVTQN